MLQDMRSIERCSECGTPMPAGSGRFYVSVIGGQNHIVCSESCQKKYYAEHPQMPQEPDSWRLKLPMNISMSRSTALRVSKRPSIFQLLSQPAQLVGQFPLSLQ